MSSYKIKQTFNYLMLTCLFFSVNTAYGANANCKTVDAAQDYFNSFDAKMESTRSEIKANEAKREAKIDEQTKKMITDGVWTEDSKKTYFAKVVTSEEFRKMEKKKSALQNNFQFSIMTAFGLKAKSLIGACEFATEAISALVEIGKINQTQYDLMDSSISEKIGVK